MANCVKSGLHTTLDVFHAEIEAKNERTLAFLGECIETLHSSALRERVGDLGKFCGFSDFAYSPLPPSHGTLAGWVQTPPLSNSERGRFLDLQQGRSKMMRAIQLAVACVVVLVATAGPVQAGLILDVGSQTDSFDGLTRGYWFTAPTGFVIDGIRVPTDASTANQSVEIVRFTSTPPEFPSTTNAFTSLFSAKDVAGTNFIATGDIFVSSGDIIGVLGSRGDGVNSYQSGNYISSGFFGNGVTLTRLLMQANLGTNTAADLASESLGSIGRVELSYKSSASAVPEPSSLALFGIGACVAGIGAARRRRREKHQDATA